MILVIDIENGPDVGPGYAEIVAEEQKTPLLERVFDRGGTSAARALLGLDPGLAAPTACGGHMERQPQPTQVTSTQDSADWSVHTATTTTSQAPQVPRESVADVGKVRTVASLELRCASINGPDPSKKIRSCCDRWNRELANSSGLRSRVFQDLRIRRYTQENGLTVMNIYDGKQAQVPKLKEVRKSIDKHACELRI